LIVPDFEYLSNYCAVKQIEYVSNEKIVRNPRIIKRFKEEVERFNRDLDQTERIKKFRLIKCDWTSESGELSPTLKLRRKFILEKYNQMIEEIYRSPEYNYRNGDE